MVQAVSRRPLTVEAGVIPMPVHWGFVADEVSEYVGVPLSIIPPMLRTHSPLLGMVR
jgi:hypothetical protein